MKFYPGTFRTLKKIKKLMCGIAAIFLSQNEEFLCSKLVRANNIIRHRGPDDEGFLTIDKNNSVKKYFGDDTTEELKNLFRFHQSIQSMILMSK